MQTEATANLFDRPMTRTHMVTAAASARAVWNTPIQREPKDSAVGGFLILVLALVILASVAVFAAVILYISRSIDEYYNSPDERMYVGFTVMVGTILFAFFSYAGRRTAFAAVDFADLMVAGN